MILCGLVSYGLVRLCGLESDAMRSRAVCAAFVRDVSNIQQLFAIYTSPRSVVDQK